MAGDVELLRMMAAIAAGDGTEVTSMLAGAPALAGAPLVAGATRQTATRFVLDPIGHYVYAGDTALHVAAAALRPPMVVALLGAGADVRARNRRGAEPLHYAVDSVPGSPCWSPEEQRQTVVLLLEAGADPNAADRGGVTPLHRAVRNRCAAAVDALLEGGADAFRPNGRGSTPAQLATWTTGRGGSGSPEARAQQEEIVRLLRRRGAGG